MVVPVQKGAASFSTSFVVLVGSSVVVFATSSTVSRISVELSPSTIFSLSRDEPFVEGRVDMALAGGRIIGSPRLTRCPLAVDALRGSFRSVSMGTSCVVCMIGVNPQVGGKADVLLGEFKHTSSGRSVFAEVIRWTLSQRMTHQSSRSR